jgi:hypothetical protein
MTMLTLMQTAWILAAVAVGQAEAAPATDPTIAPSAAVDTTPVAASVSADEKAAEKTIEATPTEAELLPEPTPSPAAPVAAKTEPTKTPAVTQVPADKPQQGTQSSVGRFRPTFALARVEMLAQGFDHLGGHARPEVSLGLERNFGDLLTLAPGIGARLGFVYSEHVGDVVGVYRSELELGVTYQFPHEGLWQTFYPYARVDFLAAWLALSAAQAMKADEFVPGAGFVLGLRVALPQTGGVRLFGLFEGGFQVRAGVSPGLYRPVAGVTGQPPPVPEASTPLGNLDMTGYTLRWGVGMEL